MDKPQINYNITIMKHSRALPASPETIRILFVVDGVCVVKMEGIQTELKKSDYLLINIQESPILEIQKDSYVISLEIDYFDLCCALGTPIACFHMDSSRGTGNRYAEMCFMLQGLIMCFVGNRTAERLKEYGLLCMIVHNLITNFAVKDTKIGKEGSKDERVWEIIQYVRMNYRSSVSLTEIAEKMFLSRSAVSRMFTQYTGKTFPVYLKELRLQSVLKDLRQTDRTISDIAVNGGFSTPSALNNIFKQEYGITPKEYREQNQAKKAEDESDENSRQIILHILEEEQKLGVPGDKIVDVVTADVSRSEPLQVWKNRLLNVGAASKLLMANMQRHVLFLQERLNIEYLRLWNLFTRQMMIIGEKKGEYNFSFLDDVLDFCVDHHFKVFLDLTRRRERAMASENREIYGNESTVNFGSSEEWLDALSALLFHLRQRYHEETVKEWVFELTFSLNDRPYYDGTEYDSVRVWEQSYELIKSLIPSVRVAGPGMIWDPVSEKGMEHCILDFINSKYAPDIFTSIHFPYVLKSGQLYGGGFEKNASRYFMEEQISEIQNILNRHGFVGEHWVTEQGGSVANRNFIQDSCYRGAEIVDAFLRNYSKVDAIGAFYASDLLDVFSDSASVLSGSGGLLSRDGIRKPAYYGYRFLKQLGSRMVHKTEHCIVTAEDSGEIRVLCWNRKYLGPLYYVSEEDSFTPDGLDRLFENLEPWWMELVLKGLDGRKTYRVRQRILNDQKGSVLHKWIDLGCSKYLSRDDLEYLEQTSIPEVTSEYRTATGDEIRVSFCLQPNELRMITITNE